jgi:hypothetical protein
MRTDCLSEPDSSAPVLPEVAGAETDSGRRRRIALKTACQKETLNLIKSCDLIIRDSESDKFLKTSNFNGGRSQPDIEEMVAKEVLAAK